MSIDGTYKITASAMDKSADGTIKLRAEGKKLTGSVSMGGQVIPIENGKVDGRKLTGQVEADTPMGHLKMDVAGKVDGDKISGTIRALLIKAEFEGRRA